MKCKICGSEIFGRDGRAKYCSDECRRIAHNAVALECMRNRANRDVFERHRRCEYCGTEYIARTRNQKYCSRECSGNARHENYIKNKPVVRKKSRAKECKCVVCGKTFIQNNVRQISCSKECSKIRQQENSRKWDRIRAKRKPIKNEPLVSKDCPKDCFYRAEITSLTSCDYILLTGTPRPCGIGKECTVYTNVGNRKKNKPALILLEAEDEEYQGYKMQEMNKHIGKEYRRGNVISRRGVSRKK